MLHNTPAVDSYLCMTWHVSGGLEHFDLDLDLQWVKVKLSSSPELWPEQG